MRLLSPHKVVRACAIICIIAAIAACQSPKDYICGVPVYGTPFQLMQELTYNANSTAFPFAFNIYQHKAYIACENMDGDTLTIICDIDTITHEIMHAYY